MFLNDNKIHYDKNILLTFKKQKTTNSPMQNEKKTFQPWLCFLYNYYADSCFTDNIYTFFFLLIFCCPFQYTIHICIIVISTNTLNYLLRSFYLVAFQATSNLFNIFFPVKFCTIQDQDICNIPFLNLHPQFLFHFKCLLCNI